jgi:hypothetical protein
MTKRYDLVSPRDRGEKTYWTRVGSLWLGDDGVNGSSLEFDALPLADKDGRVRVKVFEPREPQQPRSNGGSRRDDYAGDPPF